jgi:hypothetical protein
MIARNYQLLREERAEDLGEFSLLTQGGVSLASHLPLSRREMHF